MLFWRRAFAVAISLLATQEISGANARAASQGEAAIAEAHALAGTWLPQQANGWNASELDSLRRSKLVLTAHSFSLTQYRGLSKDVTGAFTVDPSTNPKRIDLKTDAIDLTPSGAPVQYPPCSLPGIYKIAGNVLTVCFQTGSDPLRPSKFNAGSDGCILLVLRRANPDFKNYPSAVTLHVLDPYGKPAPNQSVFRFMQMLQDSLNPVAAVQVPYTLQRTNSSGTLKIGYGDFEVACVRDISRNLMGIATASPALLQDGSATIQLQP